MSTSRTQTEEPQRTYTCVFALTLFRHLTASDLAKYICYREYVKTGNMHNPSTDNIPWKRVIFFLWTYFPSVTIIKLTGCARSEMTFKAKLRLTHSLRISPQRFVSELWNLCLSGVFDLSFSFLSYGTFTSESNVSTQMLCYCLMSIVLKLTEVLVVLVYLYD